MIDIEKLAIETGVCGDWKQAIILNSQILKKSPKDIDALNRLTYAYLQLGNKTLAKKTAEMGLKIDPYNLIAKKNLISVKNCSKLKAVKSLKTKTKKTANNINFIENPGNSKIISLICPAEKSLIEKIRNGSKMSIVIRRRKICAFYNTKYVGRFPDDMSKKYISMILGGHKFSVFFKSFDSKRLSVLIREEY